MLALSSVYYPPSLKYWEKRTLTSSTSPTFLSTKSVHYIIIFQGLLYSQKYPFQGKWEGFLRPLIPHKDNSICCSGWPPSSISKPFLLVWQAAGQPGPPCLQSGECILWSEAFPVSGSWRAIRRRPGPGLFHSAAAWRPRTWPTKWDWLQVPSTLLPAHLPTSIL